MVPNPDAIQEFRVETNNYSAQFGRSGGGVVNVITKSGTNGFHGSLFEFVRNDAFNANNWSSTSPTPPLRRNQFGGALGGPVRKDKTFFFFSYQGLRQITSTFENGAIVPTTLERAGNFSQSGLAKPLKDPYTNGPALANNVIPSKAVAESHGDENHRHAHSACERRHGIYGRARSPALITPTTILPRSTTSRRRISN